MEPKAALRELLELIEARDTEAAREKLDDLAKWIDRGGFLPLLGDAIRALS